MNGADLFAADLEFAERCLGQDGEAISDLQRQYRGLLIAYLMRSGATNSDAREIVENLWADCAVGDSLRPARFEKYHAQCPLQVWLKSIALNALIDRKRRESRFRAIEAGIVAAGGDAPCGVALSPAAMDERLTDAPLLEIMKTALLAAMGKCPAQSYVMLQLVHLNGLTQREVAHMWGWHESKVSRTLDAAKELIATETLRAIKATDPWIELGWDDFVELCRCGDLALVS